MLLAFRREDSVGKYSISKTSLQFEKWIVLFEEKSTPMFLSAKAVTRIRTKGKGICPCYQLEHV